MIRSMTGFAGSEKEIEDFEFSWEIRSVNHRFLDVTMRLPENFRVIETEFRSLISKALKRGKVECSLSLHRQSGNRGAIQIDHNRLKNLIELGREVESEMEVSVPVSALQIMQWPGVLVEQQIDNESLKEPLLQLLEVTLSKLVECREREGAELADVIQDRCNRMNEQVSLVRQRLPEIAERLRNRLQGKLEALRVDADPLRFEQEIVFLLHKIDVDEEMDRLSTHICEVERVLANEDPAGRRLDFLMQEMNREANTLGAKSVDKETTQCSVELKVLIEQMREQVQNIE